MLLQPEAQSALSS